MEKEQIYLCASCGEMKGETEHNYRHPTDWMAVEKYLDGDNKEVYEIDGHAFNNYYVEQGRCTYPHCGSIAKNLHAGLDQRENGSVFNHPYQGEEIKHYRVKLPKSSRCRECDVEYANHMARHHFSHKVLVNNIDGRYEVDVSF